eukprot:6206706-Pleurochrysis_carterae.AAC.4
MRVGGGMCRQGPGLKRLTRVVVTRAIMVPIECPTGWPRQRDPHEYLSQRQGQSRTRFSLHERSCQQLCTFGETVLRHAD